MRGERPYRVNDSTHSYGSGRMRCFRRLQSAINYAGQIYWARPDHGALPVEVWKWQAGKLIVAGSVGVSGWKAVSE